MGSGLSLIKHKHPPNSRTNFKRSANVWWIRVETKLSRSSGTSVIMSMDLRLHVIFLCMLTYINQILAELYNKSDAFDPLSSTVDIP